VCSCFARIPIQAIRAGLGIGKRRDLNRTKGFSPLLDWDGIASPGLRILFCPASLAHLMSDNVQLTFREQSKPFGFESDVDTGQKTKTFLLACQFGESTVVLVKRVDERFLAV
jgi:hypothetical protein